MPGPTPEQTLANRALEATAKVVSTAILDFEKWLVAGYGAAIGLAVPKLSEIAGAIGTGRLQVVMLLLSLAVFLSVFVLLLGTQIAAGANTGDEIRKVMPEILETVKRAERGIDMAAWRSEQEKGLWWPAIAGFRWAMRRTDAGDWVAPGRLVAKLSQLQAYLMIVQIFLGASAGVVAANGVKL